MANKKDLRPGAFAVHIMGSCHVCTNDWDAVLHMLGRLKPNAINTMPARHVFYVAGQAMAQHHSNGAQYTYAVTGAWPKDKEGGA